jgi:transaldolase/glucose-6-phosphate isomerase
MKPLEELTAEGQSVWFDFIRRDHTRGGELAALVESGVRGVTSNPSIFKQAIGDSEEYDAALEEILGEDPDRTPLQLFEAVAIVDIQEAADVLRPVYDESNGGDGYVSLEVSPTLADDAEGTIREARRLWAEVDRPNLMIKVPATAPGVAAFEQLTAEGINVNVTLMFSLQHYEDVAQAYMRGLRRATDPSGIASVASFFVSRVDSAVDDRLDEIGTDAAAALRGTAAVANAKLAYRRYEELFEGGSFADLAAKGARPQRVLWASTSTKDEAYSDVKYIEELVGDNTVNTVPPKTLDAFVDHGKARPDVVEEDVDEAAAAIAGLAAVGVAFDAITTQLQVDGVASFAAAFQDMLDTIAEKSRRLLAASVDPQTLQLGGLAAAVDDELARWDADDRIGRLWAKDHTVWVNEAEPEITDRLGWLDVPRAMRRHLEDITWFVDAVRADGIRDVVLLGMGGSSLAPDVFSRVFGAADGFPRLTVLDSTHPDAVRTLTESIDPASSVFIVASKSGTTIEPLSFFEHFWAAAADAVDEPGRHFAAITDPGTPLAALGAERGFRKVFEAIPDVGGRYSALTHFGLVPAALLGVDIELLLDQALRMAEASALPASQNPAVRLGVALGLATRQGRDKATFVVSPAFEGLPDWIEQLVAESTGKDGTGIVPIAGEALGGPDSYGPDRVFVSISLASDGEPGSALDALAAEGHPVLRIVADRPEDLGGEMFRAQMAVAAAGSVLGIHPFNQPDVQEAKELARRAMAGELDTGDTPAVEGDGAVQALTELLSGVDPGEYVALQAFVAPTPEVEDALTRLRHLIRDRRLVATTVGFGPRFLHSTGQLHKGGADNGVFVQFVDRPDTDLPVPERGYSFGELIAAQADGDHQALIGAGRRVLRIQLGTAPAAALDSLIAAMGEEH